MKGMLWLDDDKKRPLEEKVLRAAEYFEDKYGTWPTRCKVAVGLGEHNIRGVQVIECKSTLPHHFLIGN